MSNLLKKEKGFTLIEIVLVLAIAGLLLVVVFLAVTGAQKSRRDTQRKSDIARIGAALESYASNNNGDYPNSATTLGTFWTSYVGAGNFKDPSSATPYVVPAALGNTGANPTTPTSNLASGATALVTYDIKGRAYHVCISLEQGLQNCVSNQ